LWRAAFLQKEITVHHHDPGFFGPERPGFRARIERRSEESCLGWLFLLLVLATLVISGLSGR